LSILLRGHRDNYHYYAASSTHFTRFSVPLSRTIEYPFAISVVHSDIMIPARSQLVPGLCESETQCTDLIGDSNGADYCE